MMIIRREEEEMRGKLGRKEERRDADADRDDDVEFCWEIFTLGCFASSSAPLFFLFSLPSFSSRRPHHHLHVNHT